MNLLCPNCQKMLQVPEQYAGQLMKCPLCTGTFTVPALPQAPPPPPPPPRAMPPMPELGGKPVGQEPSKAAPAPPPGNYAHVRTYTLNPKVLPWLTPVCLIAVFILLFFTWVGMYPAGVQAVSQSGWQAAFGDYSAHEVWIDANKEDMEYLKNLGIGFFMLLFALLLLLAMVTSLATVLVQRRLIPVAVPAALASVWSFRGMLIAALSAGALVLLILQVASGFPIESASWKQAEQMTTKEAAAKTPPKEYRNTEEGRFRRKLDEGKEYGTFNLQSTALVSLAVFLMVLATIGAVLDWWVERRGSLPPPRLDISY